MKLRSLCQAIESTKYLSEGGGSCLFGTPFEVHEIDAHSPLPIRLLNNDYIHQLVRVVYFSNETYF